MGLAEGAAALAASTDGKALDKAEVELKLLLAQVKPRCLSGFFPSEPLLSIPLVVVPPKPVMVVTYGDSWVECLR